MQEMGGQVGWPVGACMHPYMHAWVDGQGVGQPVRDSWIGGEMGVHVQAGR